jgi:hypothetical protein
MKWCKHYRVVSERDIAHHPAAPLMQSETMQSNPMSPLSLAHVAAARCNNGHRSVQLSQLLFETLNCTDRPKEICHFHLCEAFSMYGVPSRCVVCEQHHEYSAVVAIGLLRHLRAIEAPLSLLHPRTLQFHMQLVQINRDLGRWLDHALESIDSRIPSHLPPIWYGASARCHDLLGPPLQALDDPVVTCVVTALA